MKVKFDGSVKDVPIVGANGEYQVTKENYIVPKGEEGSYHAIIEQKQFDARTGRRISKPRVQKFEPKMWSMLQRNLKLQGWDIVVLHDPSEWIKKQEEEKQKTIEERVKAQQEAAAKRKAAEREALKAEILAELKEQGIIPDTTKKAETKKGK
jgi:hypothetical protein